MGASPRSTSTQPSDRHFPASSPPLSRRQLGPRNKVVLIAEDVEDIRDLYVEFLQFRGFRTAVARDGEEAVALAVSLRPHVIIMDLKMPRLNGVGATRRLKQDRRTRGIPIILLTGYVATDQGALDAGAAVFLTKPCLPEELESNVRRLLLEPDVRSRAAAPRRQ